MIRFPVFACCAGIVAAGAVAAADLGGAVDPYYGEAKKRLLDITPEAQRMLDRMAQAGKDYRPLSGRTHLFVRTQLKYGLERTDYLHNWYERPLYQDTAYAAANVKGKYLNELSWRKQVEIGRLSKLDGFAFFPSTRGREEAIPASRLPGAEFTLLPELSGGSFRKDGGVPFCEEMMAMPNAFRIGGRTLLTVFPRQDDGRLPRIGELKRKLAAKGLADKVLLVPYSYVFGATVENEGYFSPRTDVPMLEKAAEHIRTVLRQTDGFTFETQETATDRRYNPEFCEKVVLPLVHSVLMEPEFRGKKTFGIVFSQGHENDYRWLFNYDSTGTRTFRDGFSTIEKLRPDFVVCAEWDEEDENTHFRPTVSNGHVTQRLLRHYADRFAGRVPEPFPGDDASIPNLVLSYRKSLQAGELLEAEVVNIPDGSAPADRWTVTFRWKTPDGRVAKAYAPAALDARTCGAVWFKTPVSELVEDQVLVPELTVEANGRARVFADGFWPVSLEANRNWDYKWIRESLREKSFGVAGSLAVGAKRPDGTVEVSGKIGGPVAFRSVEVLEGPDTVYMQGAPAEGRDEICVRISLQGSNGSAERNRLNGTIRVVNAKDLRCSPIAQGKLVQCDSGWLFRGLPFPARFMLSGPAERSFYATFAADSADTAEVVIDLPPVFTTRVKVKDLLSREGVGLAGPYGAYLWIERFHRPVSQPASLGEKSAKFSFLMRPKDPNGVLRLQAVDGNFRTWRGAVRTLNRPTGKTVRFHVCEKATGAVSELALDSSRVVSIDYRFDGADGDVCWSGENRLLPFVLGGSVLPVTGIGAADGGAQMSPFRGAGFTADPSCSNTAPAFVREPEGFTSLRFGGCAAAGMGLQVLPQHAGFALELKLCPDDVTGRQALLGTGNLGFELWLEDGVPKLRLSRGRRQVGFTRNEAAVSEFTAPRLAAGRWQTLRFVFDQREAYLETDGVKGDVEKFSDFQSKPCAAGFGRLGSSGLEDSSGIAPYRGRLAGFKVSPL